MTDCSFWLTRMIDVRPHRSQAWARSEMSPKSTGPCSPSSHTPSKPTELVDQIRIIQSANHVDCFSGGKFLTNPIGPDVHFPLPLVHNLAWGDHSPWTTNDITFPVATDKRVPQAFPVDGQMCASRAGARFSPDAVTQ